MGGSEKQRDRSLEAKASKTVAAKRSPLKKSHSEDSHDTTTIEQTVSQPVYSIWSGKKTYAEILKGQLEAAAQEAAAQAMRMSVKPVDEVYLQDQSVVVTTYTATVTSYVTSGITTSITAPQSIGMEDMSCYTTSSMPSSVVTSQVLEEMEVIPPGNNEDHQQASMEYGSWKVENQEQQQKPQILQLTEQDPFSYKEYVTEKAYLTDRTIEVQQNEQDFMDISSNLENQQIKQHQESFENSQNVSRTHISHDYPMDIEVTNIETSTITASSRASSNLETMSFYESVNQYPVTTFSTEVYNNNFNDISVYNDSLLTQSSSSASMFTSSIPDYMPSELMSQVQQRTPTPSLIMSSETPVQVVTDVVQTELPSTGYMHDVSLVAQGSVLDEELSINNSIVEIKESAQPPTDHKLTIHIPSDQAKLSLVVEDVESTSHKTSGKKQQSHSTAVQTAAEVDRSKLSYAQMLALNLRAAPVAAVTHTFGALKSIVSYVTGPTQAEVETKKVKEKVFEEKIEKKIPEVRVEVSEAPPERKHSGSREPYIPGLVFKDARRARTRSRSSRRKKTDQDENSKEGVEKESTEVVKENEKVEIDSPVKITTDITVEGKQDQFENEPKIIDDERKSKKNDENRKKKKIIKSSQRDDEDEVTKALREIEEMERSIKKDEDDKQKRKSSKKSRKVDSSVEKTQLDIEKTENLPGSSDKLKKTKPSKDKKRKK